MQPEDMSGDVAARYAANVGEERIPDSRVRQRVEAIVVRPLNPDQPGYSTSLRALIYKGLLEKVNDRGIVESFSPEVEVLAANNFCPWVEALPIRLIGDQQ